MNTENSRVIIGGIGDTEAVEQQIDDVLERPAIIAIANGDIEMTHHGEAFDPNTGEPLGVLKIWSRTENSSNGPTAA